MTLHWLCGMHRHRAAAKTSFFPSETYINVGIFGHFTARFQYMDLLVQLEFS